MEYWMVEGGITMKMIIEIDDESYLKSYLSILSVGILECLEKNLISYDDAMSLLYFPGIIDKFEKMFPKLGKAIDVADLIPEKLKESIEQIKKLNEESIYLTENRKQHVFYKICD